MRDTLRAAHTVGVWSTRYRSGDLPEADNRPAHFPVYPTQPVSDTLADSVESWVRKVGWGVAVQRDRNGGSR